jgi:hypothetical protein
MASTINTSIVKIRTFYNGCLPFKANDQRTNHMWGYQGWEYLEWWTCARAKENMTTRHRWRPRCRIAHGWKKSGSFVSQQRDILRCTLFISLLIHPLHIFLAKSLSFFSFLFFSFSLSFTSLFFFFLFFSIHIFFSLLFPLLTSLSLFSKLSTHLFLA